MNLRRDILARWLLTAGLLLAVPPTALAQGAPAGDANSLGSPLEQQRVGSTRQPGEASTGGWRPWVQTILALVVVIVLVVAMRAMLRRFTQAQAPASLRRGNEPQLLAVRPVSQRERLLVVRFGRRVVLVGSSPAGLHRLSEIIDEAEARELLDRLGAAPAEEPSAKGEGDKA